MQDMALFLTIVRFDGRCTYATKARALFEPVLGHSHIIMTESEMRFLGMRGFLKTPITQETSMAADM